MPSLWPLLLSSHLLWLTLLPPSSKGPVITLGPPEYSPHFKILNPSAKSLLPCRVIYSQVPGFRMWTSLRGHFCLPHPKALQWIPFLAYSSKCLLLGTTESQLIKYFTFFQHLEWMGTMKAASMISRLLDLTGEWLRRSVGILCLARGAFPRIRKQDEQMLDSCLRAEWIKGWEQNMESLTKALNQRLQKQGQVYPETSQETEMGIKYKT